MVGGMPGSLAAALTFALLISPGYQLVRGYAVVRGAGAPDKDLYVLAQAVVASLAWLAVTWVAVDDALRWVAADRVSDHLIPVLATVPLLVGAPYLLGRGAGMAIGAIVRVENPRGPGWLARVVEALGLDGRADTWDRTWRIAQRHGGALVTISLDDDSSISGQFAHNSFVAAAPAPPAVYLERAYEVADDGTYITYDRGVYIDGARIVAVKMEDS